jgi:hypothetical protein
LIKTALLHWDAFKGDGKYRDLIFNAPNFVRNNSYPCLNCRFFALQRPVWIKSQRRLRSTLAKLLPRRHCTVTMSYSNLAW